MLLFLVCTVVVVLCVSWFMGFLGHSPRKEALHAGGAMTMLSTSSVSQKRKEVCVLFGSQTGTAEMFSKTLAREAARLGIPIKIDDLENYEPHNLEYELLVIIVCATYGEGEPTDSMKAFHDWLMDESRCPGEELRQLKYTVFGLGDRQYRYFCEEGVVVDRRMAELGAQRIYGLGCGDAGQNIEEEFDEWRRDLWAAVGHTLGIQLRQYTEEPVEPECRMKVWDTPEDPLPFPKLASVLEPTQRLPAWVPVSANTELLCNASDRSTRCLEFNIEGTIISYQGGDHLGVLPRNTAALVDSYLRALGVTDAEAEQVFSLQDKKTGKNVFPARVTVRTALEWYIDLAGPPKKSTLRAIAHYCTDPVEKEKLLKLLRVEPDSIREYSKLAAKLRNVHGFLRKFSSASPPLAVFLEMMPRITPRYFSISSDLLADPKKVTITVAVVDGGLCTQMLQHAQVGLNIPVFVRKSKFHLPLRAKDRPIVMIGPGTGVAPYIGFLHRRNAWQAKGNTLGKAMLFFGCRKREEDCIYTDFMESCVANGTLGVLDIAYSRKEGKKIYVQHRIKEREGEIWEILRDGGNLYLCGDAKHMAKDVEAVLLELLQKQGAMSAEEATAFLMKLSNEERYLKDVWSTS